MKTNACEIDVNASVHQVYKKLCEVEEYPRFLQDIRQVKRIDATHFLCDGKAFGQDMQWNVEITAQAAENYMAWRNSNGLIQSGRVNLQSLDNGKTHIKLLLDYDERDPSMEPLIQARMEQDLARFKACVENEFVDSERMSAGKENAQPHEPSHFGYSGAEGSDGQERAVMSGYAAGGEGWDGNEDPGLPVVVSAGRNTEEQEEYGAVPKEEASPLPSAVQQKDTTTQSGDEDTDRLITLSDERQVHKEATWTPPFEISEQDNQVIICATLPGVTPEHVQVEIQHDKLVIEGDRYSYANQSQPAYPNEETSADHFYREVTLPLGAEPNAAVASLHDGLLEITVPISHTEKHARRLDIRSS